MYIYMYAYVYTLISLPQEDIIALTKRQLQTQKNLESQGPMISGYFVSITGYFKDPDFRNIKVSTMTASIPLTNT